VADGRLKDFLLVMDRGGLAKVLEPLAKVALDDSQLSKIADVKVGNDDVALYQLTYNASKALLFASHGDKLVVLSNPSKLYDPQRARPRSPAVSRQPPSPRCSTVTNCSPKHSARRRAPEVKQRLSVNASVLAMGYQRFIPNFAGLRFDMDDKGWHSFLAMDELDDQPGFDFKPIWQAMPMGASACVALPPPPHNRNRCWLSSAPRRRWHRP
jgi:uncharacterized protein YfaA (DUF2138 family)